VQRYSRRPQGYHRHPNGGGVWCLSPLTPLPIIKVTVEVQVEAKPPMKCGAGEGDRRSVSQASVKVAVAVTKRTSSPWLCPSPSGRYEWMELPITCTH